MNQDFKHSFRENYRAIYFSIIESSFFTYNSIGYNPCRMVEIATILSGKDFFEK
jgi:hypothetical protein